MEISRHFHDLPVITKVVIVRCVPGMGNPKVDSQGIVWVEERKIMCTQDQSGDLQQKLCKKESLYTNQG